MSIEEDYRALLAADAPLIALIGSSKSIAQDAIPPGSGAAWVVFSALHVYERGLDGGILGDQCTLATQCWAADPATAAAIADAVTAATVGAAAGGADVCVVDRSTGYDDELALDAVNLTVEWWRT